MARDHPPAATADSPSADGRPSLSWAVTPETNRWLHLLSYGLLAPLGAVALLLFGGAIAFAAVSVREGSWAVVLALGAVAVFALARPPVLAALLSEEASLGHEGWHPSRRGVLVASGLCAVAMVLAFQYSRAAAGGVFVLGFAAALVAMTLSTDAEIDGDRLETQHAGVDLTTLSSVRSLDLGGVTVFWLSYARGADGFRNPRVLAVPRERAAQVRETLDAGVDAPADADPIGRTERAVVALFGLGVLAVAPALWLLIGDAGTDETMVLIYPMTMSLVFAGPMLWYAWKG